MPQKIQISIKSYRIKIKNYLKYAISLKKCELNMYYHPFSDCSQIGDINNEILFLAL